jgi:hypothetical protein
MSLYAWNLILVCIYVCTWFSLEKQMWQGPFLSLLRTNLEGDTPSRVTPSCGSRQSGVSRCSSGFAAKDFARSRRCSPWCHLVAAGGARLCRSGGGQTSPTFTSDAKDTAQLTSPYLRVLLRSVSVEFHKKFHYIKYADVAKRENVRVPWDARPVSVGVS